MSETKEKKPRRPSVPRAKLIEAFVLGHAAGESLPEIAKKLGMSEGTLSTRATQLRAEGVALPKFARTGNTGPSADDMNELIAKLQGRDVSEVQAEAEANEQARVERAERKAAKESESE